ncbi:MAG TPA: hypothetical protein PLB52_03175 [Candidatus Moranbacteria bacterium]|nr:hypothetical protein [Candidatus Moranbacteria bacterium]
MKYPVPKVLKNVPNTDSSVIKYLREKFGENMFFHSNENLGLICPCIKANVPFRITTCIEYSTTPDGNKMAVLEKGDYEIVFHNISGQIHIIHLKKISENKNVSILGVYAGWKKNRMINWCGAVPIRLT